MKLGISRNDLDKKNLAKFCGMHIILLGPRITEISYKTHRFHMQSE